MTFKEAADLVARISYKEGWMIRLSETAWPGVARIHIEFSAPDATNPQGPVTQVNGQYMVHVDTIPSPSALVRRILQHIHSVEHHETLEFFKLDGVAVYDPHKEIERA